VGGKAQLRPKIDKETEPNPVTGVTAALLIREGIQVKEV